MLGGLGPTSQMLWLGKLRKPIEKQLYKTMKEYKVEALIYYSEQLLDDKRNSERIADSSKVEIQTKLEEYASQGYRLTSATSTTFGLAVHVYLFFEKDM